MLQASRANAGPIETSHDWLEIGECARALEASATIDPADKPMRVIAEAAARRCTLDDAELTTALQLAQGLRSAVDQSQLVDLDQFIADTEALQKQLRDDPTLAQQLRADMAAMNAASALLDQGKCYDAVTEINKVSDDNRTSVRWIRIHANAAICTASSMDPHSMLKALSDLDDLHRQLSRNQILAKDYANAQERQEEVAKEAKEIKQHVSEEISRGMKEIIDRERPHIEAARNYVAQGDCDAAEREIQGLTQQTETMWLEVKIARCRNTKESLAQADKVLDEMDRLAKIYSTNDPAIATARAEVQAQRELLIAGENDRATRAKLAVENRYKPQALAPKYTMGVEATYLEYDAGSGTELHAVIQGGVFDVAVGGTTSGPDEGSFSARGALHLLAFPYPAYSRQTLALSAGLTVRAPILNEDSMATTTWRPYIGLQARLTCVLHVNASYEPALGEGDTPVIGLGVELMATISHQRGTNAVCHE